MAATKKKAQHLNPKQKRELRGLGHKLKPTAMLGREGLTENVIASAEAILTARELLKVKIQENCELDRKVVAEELSRATGASVVQVLGRTILLYRANPELAGDKRITSIGVEIAPTPENSPRKRRRPGNTRWSGKARKPGKTKR